MSKRYPPPNEQEKAIGARIRECREVESLMSQRLFAKAFGWSIQQLKRIELGQVAPRFREAWAMCSLLNINPLWLAFGSDYRYGFVPFSRIDDEADAFARERFIDVMRELADDYRIQHRRVIRKPQNWKAEIFRERMATMAADFARKIPADQYGRFLLYISASADRFLSKRATTATRVIKARE